MLESFSKNQIKESSSNLLLLILTISMLSFFAFGNNRLGAFFITFIISFLALSILMYYVYKKERVNFELRKKDNIGKLLSLIKEPEKDVADSDEDLMNIEKIVIGRKIPTWTPMESKVYVRKTPSLNRRNFENRLKRQNYKFQSSTIKWSMGVDPHTRLGIDIIDSSLPTVLSQFGEILENDNQIQNYPYTDKDVNNLILRMDICMQNIQGRYIPNFYSKEITVAFLQSAIDYLKEKHNIPVYGNSDPFVPQFK